MSENITYFYTEIFQQNKKKKMYTYVYLIIFYEINLLYASNNDLRT